MAEQAEIKEAEVGKITHYYTKMGVAVLELTNEGISVGDTIRIKGYTTDITQQVNSIQLEHENIETAEAGQSVGIKVEEHVRQHDVVYKVIE